VTFELLPALLALAVATLFTPGPNNAMLAASGANFGFRRTIPHLLGVALGFPIMLLTVGMALGEVFQASPFLREGLRYGGAVILLWIAWKLATSGGLGTKSGSIRPMRFIGAVGFQWINPKAWTMAIAATSQFISATDPYGTAGLVSVTFLSLGLASAATWTLAGQSFARWLTSARRLRIFNIAMASLIVMSTVQLLAH
jgi:threonine/homoserine/homoserine lactone efflux protein